MRRIGPILLLLLVVLGAALWILSDVGEPVGPTTSLSIMSEKSSP